MTNFFENNKNISVSIFNLQKKISNSDKLEYKSTSILGKKQDLTPIPKINIPENNLKNILKVYKMQNNSIPEDIIKIQKKLTSFEKDSRNYKKYTKILAKHIKSYTMKKRVNSHIKTIETIEKIEQEDNQNN